MPASHRTSPRARRATGRLRLLLALALPAPALTACASSQRRAPAEARERTTVLVDNRSFLDHTVYVVRGGQRQRLGTVSASTTQRLTIPPSLLFGVAILRFQVDPIGANRAPLTSEIPVQEGDEVRLTIPPGRA